MKIHANSFYLDMNAMLNQLNSHNVHGYYNKTKANATKHIMQIQKNIDDAMKKGKANTQWMADQMDKQIEEYNAANQQMWNHAMPPQVNKAFNLALTSTPRNTDYYYPVGPNNFPDDPEPGDICWQSDDWDNVGSNDVNAQMYEYYKNDGWRPVKTKTQITGVNINGASIHGGMIQGATFRSGQQGMNGAPFWVNRDGTVYAQDFIADLRHETSRDGMEVNNCTYDGFHRFNGDTRPWGGFTLNHGLLTERAGVVQKGGTYIWSDHKYNNARVVGNTYLEPGYLKLRYNRDDQNDIVRTDLRAGNLEISGNWNQNSGIRMGYWNTTGPHITLGDWDSIEDWDGNLKISNLQGMREIRVHAPVNLINSDLLLNGDVKLKGESNPNLRMRLNGNESTLNSHGDKIRNHGTIIKGEGGYQFPYNVINGISNTDSHENRLNNQDGKINDQDGKIQRHDDAINSLLDQMGNTLTVKGGSGGDVDLNDPANAGHFEFHKDVSVIGSRLITGGEYGRNGFIADATGMAASQVNIGTVNSGNQIILTENSANGLSVNNLMMATRRWVIQNFKAKSGHYPSADY